ncbi:tyrosine recombinase XerC [Lachnospiraceae bacterium]|nr:tyrosine recombinase XerC [Lachnospiraceae bacterium]
MPKNCNKTFSQARADFLMEKKGEGLSAASVKTYKQHLSYFFNCLGDCEIIPVKDFTKDDYIFFLNFIKGDEEKNERTQQSYCRTIRVFLNWLMENEYIVKEKCFKVTLPKAQKQIKSTYTDEELGELLKDPRHCSYSVYQTWIFINFAIGTGLRLSSILAIQVKDYSPQEQTVIVNTTKSKQAQTRHLNPELCNLLNEYISIFELNSVDYLFCGSSGKQITVRGMQENVKRYNKNHGIEKTSIHLFRHTFARKFLENGGNIVDLQRLLDHSNISTTMEYIKDYSIDIGKVQEVFNPQVAYGNTKRTKQFNRKKKM